MARRPASSAAQHRPVGVRRLTGPCRAGPRSGASLVHDGLAGCTVATAATEAARETLACFRCLVVARRRRPTALSGHGVPSYGTAGGVRATILNPARVEPTYGSARPRSCTGRGPRLRSRPEQDGRRSGEAGRIGHAGWKNRSWMQNTTITCNSLSNEQNLGGGGALILVRGAPATLARIFSRGWMAFAGYDGTRPGCQSLLGWNCLWLGGGR